jgi:hypothetical protein
MGEAPRLRGGGGARVAVRPELGLAATAEGASVPQAPFSQDGDLSCRCSRIGVAARPFSSASGSSDLERQNDCAMKIAPQREDIPRLIKPMLASVGAAPRGKDWAWQVEQERCKGSAVGRAARSCVLAGKRRLRPPPRDRLGRVAPVVERAARPIAVVASDLLKRPLRGLNFVG